VGEVVRLSSGTVTLQDAVDAFLDHHDLARSTQRVYRASLATLVAGLARRPRLASCPAQRSPAGFAPGTPPRRRPPGTGS